MKQKVLFLLLLLIGANVTAQEKGTFKDSRDGRVYKTVKIGEQTWMAENLSYDTGFDCWWYNKSATLGDKYGVLYSWEAAMKACPNGWHLPKDKEWMKLEAELGMDLPSRISSGYRGTDEGEKLKAGGSSGFNVLMGGYKDYRNDVGFDMLIKMTMFWTASGMLNDAYYRNFWLNKSTIDRGTYDKKHGAYVRCVQD